MHIWSILEEKKFWVFGHFPSQNRSLNPRLTCADMGLQDGIWVHVFVPVKNFYDLDKQNYWGMNLLCVAILYGRLECLDIILRETQNRKHLWNSSNL